MSRIKHCDQSSILRPQLHATTGQNICPEPRSGYSVWPKSWTRGTFSCCCRDPFATLAARLDEFADFEFAVATLNSFPPVEHELRRIDRHADVLLFAQHSDGGPPLPSRPLHFENGSSLSLLIPLLLFARPRRIFLFGADGGLNPSFSKRPYFYYDDYDADA